MKTIIITGANGNLGNAVTQKFLASGYRVIATVIGDDDKLAMPVNAQLDVRVVNLTDSDAAKKFVKEIINQYKKIEGLLVLVGGFAMGNIEYTAFADISKMISLNFETAYNIAQPIYSHFKQNSYGRIVFIGAIPVIDIESGKEMIAYSLSKSLLFKLTEYLNADAKGKNIVASIVVPSVLDTALNRKSMPNADPNQWVSMDMLSAVLTFIFSVEADQIREPVYKVYNNS
jgi:NAD(P)-dependent dehydrogenase (short-subunit alcohol dehydrogenase family)